MSQTEGELVKSTGKCPSEEARTRLLFKIRCCKINENDVIQSTMDSNNILSDHSDEDADADVSDELKQNSKINEFLNTIKLKSRSNSFVEGDRISPYFLPEFTKNILRLCKEFPLWSNIMSPVFKSPYECATSAAVEGDFSLLKKNILKQNTTTMTVDRFLVTHLKSIESSMKIARSSQLQENNFHEINETSKVEKPISQVISNMSHVPSLNSIHLDKEYESDIMKNEYKHKKNQQFFDEIEKKLIDDDDVIDVQIQSVTPCTSPACSFGSGMTIDQEETWGGLTEFETGPFKHTQEYSNTVEKKNKRPTKYLNTCPEIDRILNRSRMRSHMSTLILNGNISPLCNYNKNTYVLNNTCPFDSVIVAIAVAYVDHEQYALFIDGSKNEFLNLAKDLGLHGSSKLSYRRRLILLMPYFDISASIPSVYTLNAECNVLKVIQDYMKHDPSSTQIAKCSNENCSGENHIRHSASIIINDLNKILKKGFTCLNMLLENYIKSESKPCIYKNCNGILHKEKKLGSHIFIETDQLDSSKCTIFLNEIPVDIILNNENILGLPYSCSPISVSKTPIKVLTPSGAFTITEEVNEESILGSPNSVSRTPVKVLTPSGSFTVTKEVNEESLRWYILGKHSRSVFTENKNTDDGLEISLISGEECVTGALITDLECNNSDNELAQIETECGKTKVETMRSNFEMLDEFELEMVENVPFNEIESDNVEYVAGYVAYRFKHKYPYLKSEEQGDTDSWINYVSKGNLSIPSRTLVNMAYKLEPMFKKLHGEGLSNKQYIIKELSTKLEKIFKDMPPEVISCLVRTRTFIRMNKLNNELLYNHQTLKTTNKIKKKKFVR
ncbi:hypothetical protein ACI65C_013684 [Semiaphis heraclei]